MQPDTTPHIPRDVLEAVLRDHLDNQTAVITEYTSTPFDHQGTNDSTSFARVDLAWALPTATMSHTATWVVKHWSAGGERDEALGIAEGRDALLWQQGWLRPAALPANLVVPIVGAYQASDASEAWLAMADVSPELGAYSRLSMPGERVVDAAYTILEALARWHAAWEQGERQDLAGTYAPALGHAPVAQAVPGSYTPPVWDDLPAELATFLEWRPTHERDMWERLLLDRRALVAGLAPYPQTLLHNDLDDRNIGLRGRDLVLIDWEWAARGPGVLDVAKVVVMLPIMVAPGTPIPPIMWSDAFAQHYWAHYVAAGGTCTDWAAWRHAYGLAVVGQALSQMPFTNGRMLRAINGETQLPQIVGVPPEAMRHNLQASLLFMEQMAALVEREAQRLLCVDSLSTRPAYRSNVRWQH
jgi:hypothetical protein